VPPEIPLTSGDEGVAAVAGVGCDAGTRRLASAGWWAVWSDSWSERNTESVRGCARACVGGPLHGMARPVRLRGRQRAIEYRHDPGCRRSAGRRLLHGLDVQPGRHGGLADAAGCGVGCRQRRCGTATTGWAARPAWPGKAPASTRPATPHSGRSPRSCSALVSPWPAVQQVLATGGRKGSCSTHRDRLWCVGHEGTMATVSE